MIQLLNTRKFNNTSRYTRNRQIYNKDLDAIYLESFNKYSIQLSDTPVYHVVDFKEEGRLDIISNLYYGTPDFYWAIALANNIIDPFILKANTIITIPYIDDLFNNDGPLSISNF